MAASGIEEAMRPMAPERWQQVKELYDAALAREPGSRAAFLAEACAGDPDLQREIESLLQSNEEVGSFLSATALKASSSSGESFVGRRIGSYKLVGEIGHGGMGTVYLADRADEIFRKRVAIKLIKRGMDTESILRRFENERRILAGLDHPNIARLLDGGTTEDGLPYFVMEYIEGQPLYQYCDANQLPINERLKLFRAICSAVQYAHQNLVVHRDLKPKNILVTAERIPKLLDFGIAKFLKPELSSHTIEPTAPAARLMTPEYASPEQVRGEPITPASDIYSLGVLLYGLLTGHRPYVLKTGFPDEVSRVICEEEPEAPSAVIARIEPAADSEDKTTLLTPESVSKVRDASPEQLRRRLRGDLDNIVLKAMHKAPQGRYPSVGQLSEDIGRHLEGLPVSARKKALSYRLGKIVRKQKTSTVAAGLILLALVAATATVWQARGRSSKASDHAVQSLVVLPFVNSTADPNTDYLSDGITESVINSLSQLPQLHVMARWTSFRFKGREVDPQEVGRKLGVDAVLSGSAVQRADALVIQVELVKAADGTQMWGDHYHRPISEVFAMQEDIAKAIADKLRFKLTEEQRRRVSRRETENQEAYKAYLRARHSWNKRTKEGIKTAIEQFQTAIEIDPTYASAHAGLANAYAVLPIYDRLASDIGYARAEAAAQTALKIDQMLSEAWTALGWIKFSRDMDLPAAGKQFAHALELNPNDPTAHQWYAFYLSALGRFDQAISEIDRALKLDPLSPIINNSLGRTLYYARRYPEAIKQFQKALELEPGFHPAHYNLGSAYVKSEMYPEAIAEWQNDDGPTWIARRAYAAALSGDKREAISSVEMLKKLSHQRDIPAIIALLYLGLGEKEPALDWLEKAYQGRDVWLIFLKVEPEFDPLRSHPRFNALLKQLQLEP
jgi:serine/threonine protein kinase/tetratricopeptide (TPR) repeat protein